MNYLPRSLFALLFISMAGCNSQPDAAGQSEQLHPFWGGAIRWQFSIYYDSEKYPGSDGCFFPRNRAILVKSFFDDDWRNILIYEDNQLVGVSRYSSVEEPDFTHGDSGLGKLLRSDPFVLVDDPLSYELLSALVRQSYSISYEMWPDGVYKSTFQVDWGALKELYDAGYYEHVRKSQQSLFYVPVFIKGAIHEDGTSSLIFRLTVDFEVGLFECWLDPNVSQGG